MKQPDPTDLPTQQTPAATPPTKEWTELPADGTRPSPELTQPGTDLFPQVPGYEILDILGHGGMGIVYKARQITLGRLVALKMTLAGRLASAPERARFVAEAESVARLQHPSIVQIHEVGKVEGCLYLALEYVAGGTLADLTNRRPQPARAAAELVRTLARAIHHAHERGIVHRDLKPANILLAATPTHSSGWASAKITDFGLAKDLQGSTGPTRAGDILGTPSYMAPEQAGGVIQDIGPATDIWALGAILYELLTGRPPFLDESAAQTVVQVLTEEPVLPTGIRPDCPRDLETICLKCLQKPILRRYPTAAELAADLDRFLAGEPIQARPAGRVERLLKWARRKPATATLVAGCILAAVAALATGLAYNTQLRRHNEALEEAVRREEVARRRAELHYQNARQAVKDLLAEVGQNDLANIPAMDPVRRLLLRKALRYLEGFLRDHGDDPAVQFEAAQVAGDAAEVHEMLGELSDAETQCRRAVVALRQLHEETPTHNLYQSELALALMRLANLLADNGRRDEAEPVLVDSLERFNELVQDQPDVAAHRYQRSRALLNHGRLLVTTGRQKDAEKAFLKALDELTELAKRHPAVPEYREKLAGACNNLSVLYKEMKRFPEAVQLAARAVELLRQLTEQHPEQRSYRTTLAITCSNYGSRLWEVKQWKSAETAYVQSLEERERLARDFPHLPDYHHNLALSCENLGHALQYLDRIEDGKKLVVRALEIKQRLVKEQPTVALYHSSLGLTLENQSKHLRDEQKWSEARTCLEQAREEYRTALNGDLRNQRYRNSLRSTCLTLADTLRKLGESKKADQMTAEAAALEK